MEENKTKEHACDVCGITVFVDADYEPVFCCEGLSNECYCMGAPINPVFCDECLMRMIGDREWQLNLVEEETNENNNK